MLYNYVGRVHQLNIAAFVARKASLEAIALIEVITYFLLTQVAHLLQFDLSFWI